MPSFGVDNAGAVRATVEHLFRSGRRAIAMIKGPDWLPCTRPPAEAYVAFMQSVAAPVCLLSGDFTAAGGRRAMREALLRWPDIDAVVAGNDAMAFGAMKTLHEQGIDVPGDIAVAGFDDVPFASLFTPALTSGSHPVRDIAAAATRTLLGETPAAPTTTVYRSELVLRDSA